MTADDLMERLARANPVPDVESWAVWIPEGEDWRLIPSERVRRCARPWCPTTAIVELNRGPFRRDRRDAWWAYCAEHMYGRRIIADRIYVKVRRGSPAHEAAG